LRFVNTLTTEGEQATEALPSFRMTVAWLRASGVLRSQDARALLAYEGSEEASEALAAVHTFRATLRTMLDELHTRGTIGERYVKAINVRLDECGCHRALVREGERYVVRVQYRFERPRDLLMPLANAAAELLAHEDLTRIKRCGSDCCDMYFLDTSRNRSRTWCEMAACGNRAKAAAYYRRSRGSGEAVRSSSSSGPRRPSATR
jgi:predicted RNA-binding Zn ribbon-like protein